MSKQTHTQTLNSEIGHDDENELEDEEEVVEKLEADVNRMAQKILEYRTTLPDQLKSALASTFVAQRPLFPTHYLPDGSDPGPSGRTSSDVEGPVEIGKRPLLAEDHDMAEKTRLLKQKITGSASALPGLLKRTTECIARIDALESSNEFLHPVFKRKKTS